MLLAPVFVSAPDRGPAHGFVQLTVASLHRKLRFMIGLKRTFKPYFRREIVEKVWF